MKSKYTKKRPTIPAEVKREAAIESGHACAIKKCTEHTYNEYHHIDGNRENNTPANLIYLCDKHHKMAHKGIIDKKSLKKYKKINQSLGAKDSEKHAKDIEKDNDHNNDFNLEIDKFRPLDVLEDNFTLTSKEMGIKLYEIWRENSYTYSCNDFSQLLHIPEEDIHKYFTGEISLDLQHILLITKLFNLSKDHFFIATYWMKKAIWKEEVVKFSILNAVTPKINIDNIENKGKFYYSILSSYSMKLCKFHEHLYGEKVNTNPFQEERNEIDKTLKKDLSNQYYKLLEQYPRSESRDLLCHEKILCSWCSWGGKYVARVIIEGIKSIDISDIKKPIVICRFDVDLEEGKVIRQGYDEKNLKMEK